MAMVTVIMMLSAHGKSPLLGGGDGNYAGDVADDDDDGDDGDAEDDAKTDDGHTDSDAILRFL